jgi:hypothetical protein
MVSSERGEQGTAELLLVMEDDGTCVRSDEGAT